MMPSKASRNRIMLYVNNDSTEVLIEVAPRSS